MVKAVDTLPADMPIEDAVAFFTGETKRHRSYPVVDDQQHVVGMVDRADVLRWMSGGAPEHRTLDDLFRTRRRSSAIPARSSPSWSTAWWRTMSGASRSSSRRRAAWSALSRARI